MPSDYQKKKMAKKKEAAKMKGGKKPQADSKENGAEAEVENGTSTPPETNGFSEIVENLTYEGNLKDPKSLCNLSS